MNSLKSFLIFVFFIPLNYSYSQTGPGGVGSVSSNGLWLKADDITLSSGSTISNWSDVSGNNNDGNQTTSTLRPIFITNSSMNNMPAVRLDGSDDELIVSDANILDGTSGMTYFTVLRPNDINSSTAKAIFGKRISHSGNDSQYAYTLFFWSSNYLHCDINTANNRFTTNPTSFSNATNYILSLDYDGSLPTTTRSKIYSAGSLIRQSTESSTSVLNSNADLVIGSLNVGDGRHLGADLAEIIQYNYSLNDAEHVIVNNYLSAKYNTPLTSNDLYAQDNISNGNFDHDVAGIGQATNGDNHTDSQGSGIVRMSSPSALSSGDYLFWGEETKDPTYNFSTNTTNYLEQLNSRWRISKINDLGTVTVAFDISSIDLTGKQSCQPLQLIVDNDSDFSSPTTTYSLTISGTTATATGVTFTDGDYFTLRYLDQIVWDGTNFFNGSGTANAPDNTDSCLKFTVKSGATGTLNLNAHVREVEVETGGNISVSDGILLQIETQVVIDGIIDLLGEAQLIQNHSTTTSNSGSGTLNIRQQGTSNLYNYNYWSSPVNIGGSWQIGNLEDVTGIVQFQSGPNANASTSPITLSSRWLYEFNGLSDNYFDWKKLTTASNLLPGIGFTMKGSSAATANQEYIFKGIPNDGNYTYAVTAGNDFLVGNPYPSALDAEQFIIDNAGVIDGTLYFWEHFTSNNSHFLIDYEGGYATYTSMMGVPAVADASGLTSGNGSASLAAPTQNITVGQGFFVTIENTGNLVFNNGQRFFARESLSETIFFKSNTKKQTTSSDQRTKIWFSFKEPNNRNRIFGLGYDTRATNTYDNGFDAKTYEEQRNDINWRLGDDKLIIQALPEININDELPLDVKITDTGIYKFSIDRIQNFPDATEIYLKDNNENVYYNLKNGDVEVLLNATGYYNEFSIVFKKDTTLGTTASENENFFTTYNLKTKQVVLHNIDNLNNIKSLDIYNTLGQQIISLNSLDTNIINVSNLSDGIYILKINTKHTKNFASSKFVKY